MENWQRKFAYITGSVVFGLLIIILTHTLFGYVNEPGWVGYLALTGFGLVYLNVSYLFGRRYTKRTDQSSTLSYLLAALILVPTLLWIYTKETELAESRLVFTLVAIFSAFLGAYFGIRGGIRRRAAYFKNLKESQEGGVSEDLQRPHDQMSGN
ncbi:MAG: hypothetical protein R3211_08560 [Balneolaceae bacterium]|nr:hypothetical protein [Balneolaceae bacterium]